MTLSWPTNEQGDGVVCLKTQSTNSTMHLKNLRTFLCDGRSGLWEKKMKKLIDISSSWIIWDFGDYGQGCFSIQIRVIENENYRMVLGGCSGGSWLRIQLPMPETWVQFLIWEDPTCCRATKPMSHNYWTCALEHGNHNRWAHMPHLLKPAWPRACVQQQEKPLQCEATREWPPLAVN